MFDSEAHDVFAEKVNKIGFGANDDKRIQTPDGVTLPETDPGRVCKGELMTHPKIKNLIYSVTLMKLFLIYFIIMLKIKIRALT